MLFSSPLFIFIFLPIVLAGYYLIPRGWRNGFLLLSNLVFYGWGEPLYVWIMVFSIAVNYGMGLCVERYRHTLTGRWILFAALCANLLLLGFFKYTGFFSRLAANVFGGTAFSLDILLPIGISFYTFQGMSYVIDVYRKDTAAQKNPIVFGTYISLFPQLIAGPIVRYRDVAEQLEHRQESVASFASGVRLFTGGLCKKVLLANQAGILWEAMQADPAQNGWLGSWMGIIAFAFQIYFDFSGYSDMARGLGRMFGFEFMVNFNYPYIAKSITEFWRRWHISLSSWFRDYVYFPLGGSRGGKWRTVLNLFIVWTLTGFWHGANYNFILWGLYYFVILALEKFVLQPILKKLPAFWGHAYALFLVLLGWVIFSLTDMGKMAIYFNSMFSFRNGAFSETALSMCLTFLPLLLVSAFASTPFPAKLRERFTERRMAAAVEMVFLGGGLLLCTAALVSQSYNPFLYFRF